MSNTPKTDKLFFPFGRDHTAAASPSFLTCWTEYELLEKENAALRFDAERYGRVKQFLQHGNGSTLDARGTDSAAFDALIDALPKEEGK